MQSQTRESCFMVGTGNVELGSVSVLGGFIRLRHYGLLARVVGAAPRCRDGPP